MTAGASEIGRSVHRVRPGLPPALERERGEGKSVPSAAGVGQGIEQLKLLASLTFPEPLYFGNVG